MEIRSTSVEECSSLFPFDSVPEGKLWFLGVISLQIKEKYSIVF